MMCTYNDLLNIHELGVNRKVNNYQITYLPGYPTEKDWICLYNYKDVIKVQIWSQILCKVLLCSVWRALLNLNYKFHQVLCRDIWYLYISKYFYCDNFWKVVFCIHVHILYYVDIIYNWFLFKKSYQRYLVISEVSVYGLFVW